MESEDWTSPFVPSFSKTIILSSETKKLMKRQSHDFGNYLRNIVLLKMLILNVFQKLLGKNSLSHDQLSRLDFPLLSGTKERRHGWIKALTSNFQRFKESFNSTIPINVNNNIVFLTSRFLALIMLCIHCDPNVLIQDKISDLTIREQVF